MVMNSACRELQSVRKREFVEGELLKRAFGERVLIGLCSGLAGFYYCT